MTHRERFNRAGRWRPGTKREPPSGGYGIIDWPGGSVRLEARELHYLAPFLGFICDELAEVGGIIGLSVPPTLASDAFDLG